MLSYETVLTQALQKNENIATLRRVPLDILNNTERNWTNHIFEFIRRFHEVPPLETFIEDTTRMGHLSPFVPQDTTRPFGSTFEIVIEDLQRQYIHQTLLDIQKKGDGWDRHVLQEALHRSELLPDDSILLSDVHPGDYRTDIGYLPLNDVPFITENVGKVLKSDFIIFSGMAKSGKTTTSRWVIHDLLKQGFNVLVISPEITPIEFCGQMDAIIGKFNPFVFRTLEFSDEVNRKMDAGYEWRSKPENYGEMFVNGPIQQISDLQAILQKVNFPVHAVFIDGLHLFGNGAGSMSDNTVSLKNTSNACKLFATRNQIPVFAVVQANRGADGKKHVGQAATGGTVAFNQDATLLVHISSQKLAPSPNYPGYTMGFTYSPVVNRAKTKTTYIGFANFDEMEVFFDKPKHQPTEEEILEDWGMETRNLADSMNNTKQPLNDDLEEILK